jgi:hypothetical protein
VINLLEKGCLWDPHHERLEMACAWIGKLLLNTLENAQVPVLLRYSTQVRLETQFEVTADIGELLLPKKEIFEAKPF